MAHRRRAGDAGAIGSLEVWRLRGLAVLSTASPSPACGRSCISCISCWSSQSYLGKLPAKTPVCFLLHDAVGPIGHIGPLGRRLTPLYTTPHRRPAGAFCSSWPWKVWPFGPARSVLWGGNAAPPPSPKHGVRSPPCPTGLRAVRTPCAHARPVPSAVFLCVLCVLCDFQTHWQSFVYLRGPSCSSCQPRRANLPHPPSAPHPSPRRGASVLCSLFSVL